MKSTYNIGRIFGIQFRLHFSWFFVFLLVTLFLSWQVFPSVLGDEPVWLYIAMGAVTSLLFFASVLTHELAHSLVARSQGIPISGITLFIFGGAAQITREASRPSDEFKLAVAGPGVSLVIATAFWFIYAATGYFSEPVALMAQWLAYINVVLAFFNLLPGFPLDGGRVLRAAIWHISGDYMRATRLATLAGQAIGYLLIAGGIALVFLDSSPVSGLWLMLIGWFLADTARISYRQARMQQALKGIKASEVMTSCPVVDGSTSVAALKEQYAGAGYHCFLVSEGERVGGYLTLHNIGAILPSAGGTTRLRDIAIKLNNTLAASPDQDVLSIVQQMNEQGIHEVPVMDDGRVVGLVLLDDLIRNVTSLTPFNDMHRR